MFDLSTAFSAGIIAASVVGIALIRVFGQRRARANAAGPRDPELPWKESLKVGALLMGSAILLLVTATLAAFIMWKALRALALFLLTI